MRRLMTSLVFASLLAAIAVLAQGRLQAHGDQHQPIVLASMSLEECGFILFVGPPPYHDARGNEYRWPCDAKAQGVPIVWLGPAH